MGIEETLRFIRATSCIGSRMGLERMQNLMNRLGNPQNELRFIHVAGTSGKGSVCVMLSSVLSAAGYRAGLYTFPHLKRVNERMKIDGDDITDENLISTAEQVKLAVDAMEEKPTEFEIVTAMAFLYFRQQRCDIVVLEAGPGGRLDATNIITAPVLSVIMNIGPEHADALGTSLQEIAAEKAGIIQKNGTIVLYPQLPSIELVFEQVCEDRHATLVKANANEIVRREESLDGQTFDWKQMESMKMTILGRHQLMNAAVALTAVDQLVKFGWTISEENIREGLAAARCPARFEILNRAPLFILDGAYTPQYVDMLEQSLEILLPEQKIVLLLGVRADQDVLQMLKQISHRIKEVICLTPDSDRALPAETLAELLQGYEIKATAFDDAERGIIAALSAAKGKPVVAFGSLRLAGAVRDGFPLAFKKWQRRESIRMRDAMSESQRAARSQKIVQRIAESPEFEKAHTIMSYRAMRGEVDLAELDRIAAQKDKKIVYPLCVNRTEMIALHPNDEAAWQKGVLGIREPMMERSTEVMPEEIDLVLCPCTSFDENCNRLGMGAGYYDRFLPRCKNAAITAVAFEVQKSPNVMTEPHDQKMEKIFTDACIYFDCERIETHEKGNG